MHAPGHVTHASRIIEQDAEEPSSSAVMADPIAEDLASTDVLKNFMPVCPSFSVSTPYLVSALLVHKTLTHQSKQALR